MRLILRSSSYSAVDVECGLFYMLMVVGINVCGWMLLFWMGNNSMLLTLGLTLLW